MNEICSLDSVRNQAEPPTSILTLGGVIVLKKVDMRILHGFLVVLNY